MPTEQGSIVLGAAHDIAPTMPPFSEEILPLERSVTIRELTPEDADLITAAFDILDHPANDIHMVDVTESESDIVERINTPGTYVFVGVNETGEVIGTAMATDSKKRVRRKRTTDIIVTSVELFATKTSVQSQRSRSAGDEPGYGTHMYQALEKYLFEDNGITSDGLQREMITIRIKRGVPGWERMLKIALKSGMKKIFTRPRMIRETDEDGNIRFYAGTELHGYIEVYADLRVSGGIETLRNTNPPTQEFLDKNLYHYESSRPSGDTSSV